MGTAGQGEDSGTMASTFLPLGLGRGAATTIEGVMGDCVCVGGRGDSRTMARKFLRLGTV